MPDARRPIALLRAAFVAVVGFALLTAGWLAFQAVQHPGTHARQFGKYGEAVPLWLPLILFVLFGLAAVAYVFFRAARRLQAGDDLYENRVRRRPDQSHAP